MATIDNEIDSITEWLVAEVAPLSNKDYTTVADASLYKEALTKFGIWIHEQYKNWLGEVAKLAGSSDNAISQDCVYLQQELERTVEHFENYPVRDMGNLLGSIRQRIDDDKRILRPKLEEFAMIFDIPQDKLWFNIRLNAWEIEIEHISNSKVVQSCTDAQDKDTFTAHLAKSLEDQLAENRKNVSDKTQKPSQDHTHSSQALEDYSDSAATFSQWLISLYRAREEADQAAKLFKNWIVAKLREINTTATSNQWYAEKFKLKSSDSTDGSPYALRIALVCCHHYMNDITQKSKESDLGDIPYAKVVDAVDESLRAYRDLLVKIRDKFKVKEIRDKWAAYYHYSTPFYNMATGHADGVYEWVEFRSLFTRTQKSAKATEESLVSLFEAGKKKGEVEQDRITKLAECFSLTQTSLKECIDAVDGR